MTLSRLAARVQAFKRSAAAGMETHGTSLRYQLMERAAVIGDVIRLGRGDPDFDTPPHIIEGAIRSTRVAHRASPVRGFPELREAIATKTFNDSGITVDPAREVLVTNGGQEALYLAAQALVGPGDEVLIPDPRYTSYDDAIRIAGASAVLVPTSREQNFDVDPMEVERRITPKSKLLLVITPSNPTAGIISPTNIERLAKLAKAHDLFVIFDEIYEKLIYDGGAHLPMGRLDGMAQRTLTLNAFSKTYAMTGWRVGWVAGPSWLIEAMEAIKALLSGPTAAVSQWAGIAALTGPQQCVADMRAAYDQRRRLLMQALDDLGVPYGHPFGGYYVWADIGAAGVTGRDLAQFLLEHARVLVFPGESFGEAWGNYMRISYAIPTADLQVALGRIREAFS